MHRIDVLSETPDLVVLRVAGHLSASAATDLAPLISAARTAGRQVAIDLGAVTIVAPEVVECFARGAARGLELRNCPHFLRAWLDRRAREESSR